MGKKQHTIDTSHALHLVWVLAWKNIKVKYKNSFFGFFWSLLNPLIFLLIFSYIFGQAFQHIENYKLFALSGLVVWSLFPVASSQVISSLVENAGILKSLNVPSVLFPASALVSSVINFAITLVPFSILMFFFGWRPGIEAFLMIPVIVLFAAFIGGLSLLLCSLNIYYRDVGLLWNTFLPAVFYFTPIAYPVNLIPENIRWVMKLNPVYHFIHPFREIVYNGTLPVWKAWGYMFTLALVSIAAGLYIYRKLQKGFISNY